MSVLTVIAILLTLVSLFGYANQRWLGLPHAIGVLVMALTVSLVLIAADPLLVHSEIRSWTRGFVGSVNLPETLLNGILSVLLFAGSLQVDVGRLWSRKGTVLMLATAGTLLATLLFAAGIWAAFRLVGHPVSPAWCCVLGAILAPTDPVAVAGLLRRVSLPPTLQAVFAGESLFNDGVGVVVFGIALGIATGDGAFVGAAGVATTFLVEAVGGAALGLLVGWVGIVLMRRIDNAELELTISLAVATGVYSLGSALHLSGPIGVVMAGLLIGTHGLRYAMSERTRHHFTSFWSMTDELLNALLFLLIGFEVLSLEIDRADLLAALIAMPLSLAVRFVSVAVPALPLNLRARNRRGALAVLSWGGLRGGISVAMALALPQVPARAALLTVCYAVVVFTVVVQGLTMGRVIEYFYGPLPLDEAEGAGDTSRPM